MCAIARHERKAGRKVALQADRMVEMCAVCARFRQHFAEDLVVCIGAAVQQRVHVSSLLCLF